MANVGGKNLIRRESTEIRHFLFCFDSSHVAAFPPPQNKNNILKFKTRGGEGGRRKRQGKGD